ncbi:MAG: hypothetical protein WEA56_12605 [Balneolaceae bacterium]
MTKISRWFIKMGMVYFLLGMFLSFVSELPFLRTGSLLLPVYWHMLVMGWITQVIIGVSIWMFPRKRHDQSKKESRLAWFCFWTLNTGLVLRFLSEPFLPLFQGDLVITITVIFSSALQVLAVIFYVAEIWPRVQPKKKRKRETV